MSWRLPWIFLALFIFVNSASAALIQLPKPVPLKEESVDLLRKSSETDGDQWKLVVFGFSHCQDICPRSLENMGFLLDAATEQEVPLDGVFVTIDPDRDTELVLSAFTEPLGKKASYLRLKGDSLERFKAEFGAEAVFYTKNAGNQDHYQVDHSSTAFLIDPGGRIRIVFDALEDVKAAAAILQEQRTLFQK